jgi:hypothetical protein
MNFSTPKDWQMWAQAFPIRAAADAKYVSPFRVLEARDEGGKKIRDILLYGPIGKDWMSDDGTSASEFAQILADIPANETPRLRINSPGGNVWEGFAIYNLAKERGARLTVARVDPVGRAEGLDREVGRLFAGRGHVEAEPPLALQAEHPFIEQANEEQVLVEVFELLVGDCRGLDARENTAVVVQHAAQIIDFGDRHHGGGFNGSGDGCQTRTPGFPGSS